MNTKDRFKVWRTIKLGGKGLKTADNYRAALERADCKVSALANNLLGQPAFTVATKETEASLVVLSNEELGYPDGARYEDVCKRGVELGYDLCEPEDGPALRLSYLDQQEGEWLIVAMEPITDSGGNLDVFSVKHDGNGLLLYGPSGHPDYFWHGNHRFVFRLRK